MGAIGKQKVHPSSPANNGAETPCNQVSRSNGWSTPLHPLQVLAWLFFLLFGGIYFGVMVPVLPTPLSRWVAVSTNGLVFGVHFVIHLLSVTINPADESVIQKYYKSTRKLRLNRFDRTKHVHVIENQFCYICEVTVGPKSKHCSVCNKCVSDFDHHCKWLNNCVGGRNYRLFMGCVTTALLGALIIFILSLVLTIAYFNANSWLYDDINKGTQSTLSPLSFEKLGGPLNQSAGEQKPSSPSSPSVEPSTGYRLTWIFTVILTLLLSFVSILLLAHLLCFHIFLNCVHLSTYEFIVQRRQTEAEEGDPGRPSAPTSIITRNPVFRFLSTYVFICCSKRRAGRMKPKDSQENPVNATTMASDPSLAIVKLTEGPLINPTFVDQIIESATGSPIDQSTESIDTKDYEPSHVGSKGGHASSNSIENHGNVYLGSPQRRFMEELKLLRTSSLSEENVANNKHREAREVPLNRLLSENQSLSVSVSKDSVTSDKSLRTSSSLSHKYCDLIHNRLDTNDPSDDDVFASEPIFRPLQHIGHQNGRVSRLSFAPKGHSMPQRRASSERFANSYNLSHANGNINNNNHAPSSQMFIRRKSIDHILSLSQSQSQNSKGEGSIPGVTDGSPDHPFARLSESSTKSGTTPVNIGGDNGEYVGYNNDTGKEAEIAVICVEDTKEATLRESFYHLKERGKERGRRRVKY